MTPDADVDAAQESVDEQAKWGESFDSRAIARLVRWAKRAQNVIENQRDRTTALEARVKALEDRQP